FCTPQPRGSGATMPSSAVLRFTDPDAYYAAIRTAEVKGVVTTRGDYRAELTRIELHRLWMQRDRKSTRLNSSHSQISYAVFCLNIPPPSTIYTLSLHDALPIFLHSTTSWIGGHDAVECRSEVHRP